MDHFCLIFFIYLFLHRGKVFGCYPNGDRLRHFDCKNKHVHVHDLYVVGLVLPFVLFLFLICVCGGLSQAAKHLLRLTDASRGASDTLLRNVFILTSSAAGLEIAFNLLLGIISALLRVECADKVCVGFLFSLRAKTAQQ